MPRMNGGEDAAVDSGCPRRIDTATYLLDGMDPTEGEEFARHLNRCPTCRAETDELAPVARRLAGTRRQLSRRRLP